MAGEAAEKCEQKCVVWGCHIMCVIDKWMRMVSCVWAGTRGSVSAWVEVWDVGSGM